MFTRGSTLSRENAVNIQNQKLVGQSLKASTRSTLAEIGNAGINKSRGIISKKSSIPVKKGWTKIAARTKTTMAPKEEVMEVDTVEHVECCVPENVKDIDLKDASNPQLCSEYVPQMYSYLRQLEEQTTIRPDFLKGCSINGKMRAVLLNWLIEVHCQFKLLQETLYMTVAILDRFLQEEGPSIKRCKLQLVGVTAMWIASKVEEMFAPEVSDFVYVTDNSYTTSEVRAMELRMLRSINFGLGRPLPLHFLRRNSKAGDVDMLQHSLAKYLLECSILSYELAAVSPSVMAAAALYLAIRLTEPDSRLDSCWTPTLAHYSAYSKDQLLPVVFQIAALVRDAKESKFQFVHKKYESKKLHEVAKIEELRGDMVKKLAEGNVEGL